MVKGLDTFRSHFRDFTGAMTLIGGAACQEHFAEHGVTFRPPSNLDLVLLPDSLPPAFADALSAFVQAGGYRSTERSFVTSALYRFTDPTHTDFPVRVELVSLRRLDLALTFGQRETFAGASRHAESVMLLAPVYLDLLRCHHVDRDGLRMATVASLIPLKAYAWLNLTEAGNAGAPVAPGDLKKHRADVFRLAATLPGEFGPSLNPTVATHLRRFLDAFHVASEEWPVIQEAVRSTVGTLLSPDSLRRAIQTYFAL